MGNSYYETIQEKYKDLWMIKENSYGEIKMDDALVIFLDGKNITKNHSKYPMLGKNNFTEMMMFYGYDLVKEINADAVIYASIDEISFIFKSPEQLMKFYNDDSRSCLEALFIQDFVERFWKYKKAYFKCTLFNIQSEHIDKWVSFRRAVGDNVGLTYVLKEKLPKQLYHDCSRAELESLLITSGLTDFCTENSYIRNGYYKEHSKRSPIFLENSISTYDFLDT